MKYRIIEATKDVFSIEFSETWFSPWISLGSETSLEKAKARLDRIIEKNKKYEKIKNFQPIVHVIK